MNTKTFIRLVPAVLLACAHLHLNAHMVTTTDDCGPGSLRQLVTDVSRGATITFDASLSGQTIILSSGQILITDSITIAGRPSDH